MCGDGAGSAPKCHDRANMQRRFSLTSAVTFVLLAACALVCLSPTVSGFRAPAAGAVGLHRSPGGVVAVLASAHSNSRDAGIEGPGSPSSSPLSQHAHAAPHHSVKPTNGTTKNGASSVHIVFTQAGAERWDAHVVAEFPKDVPALLGERSPPDPTTEATNTSVATVDSKVQISFGNISAARAQQFASSL
jgi:hypothetical protein